MTDVIARYWWTFVLRGALAIIFGLVAWFWPGLALQALIYVFAAYALVDGVFALIAIFRDEGRARWLGLLLEGILGVGAAIVAVAWPGLTALTFLYFVAAWTIIAGVFRIITAIRLRDSIENEWWMGLGGLLSIVFGILLILMRPEAGLLALVWLVGVWAIIFGVVLIAFGFRMRGRHESLTTGTDAGSPASAA